MRASWVQPRRSAVIYLQGQTGPGADLARRYQIVGTSFESMIRASDVTRGTPSTRAVATMIRSAGSQSRVEPSAITALAMAGVTGWTSTRGAAVARAPSLPT